MKVSVQSVFAYVGQAHSLGYRILVEGKGKTRTVRAFDDVAWRKIRDHARRYLAEKS